MEVKLYRRQQMSGLGEQYGSYICFASPRSLCSLLQLVNIKFSSNVQYCQAVTAVAPLIIRTVCYFSIFQFQKHRIFVSYTNTVIVSIDILSHPLAVCIANVLLKFKALVSCRRKRERHHSQRFK